MPGIEVIRDVYAAFAAQDFGAVLALTDPQCVITQDPRLPWGGRYVGHDGFAEFGANLVGTIDSAVTTESLFEADDTVIQCGRTRGTVRANGAAFDVGEVHTWKVREGKVVAAHFAIDTEAMLDAIGRP
jgi:ketosteroid isomerase-like protein